MKDLQTAKDTSAAPKNQEFTIPTYLNISKIAVFILYAWTLVGTVLLGLRVFLLAFYANMTTPFVEFIYRTSADYLAPFRGIFPARPIGETGYLDVAAIFAIIIYLLAAWALRALITYVSHKIEIEELQYKKKLAQQQREATQKASTVEN